MSLTIAIDTHSGQRVSPILTLVQQTVPAADDAYVLTGALGVGLNFLLDPVYQFDATDFADPSAADDTVSVDPIEGDEARAESLAAALEVDVSLIYSAALCTGLARLLGSPERLTGPFAS